MQDIRYPIVEIFNSIQGEGFWSGTPMLFIRLGGCSIGGKTRVCTSWTGNNFKCDTNYNTSAVMTIPDIIAQIPKKTQRVCLTGGEPFLHDLIPLYDAIRAFSKKINVHIETSGTRTIPELLKGLCWITVSPKYKCLPESLENICELKILIKKGDKIKDIREIFATKSRIYGIYLQPVDDENYPDNSQHAVKLCLANPEFRLSIQVHKLIGVR